MLLQRGSTDSQFHSVIDINYCMYNFLECKRSVETKCLMQHNIYHSQNSHEAVSCVEIQYSIKEKCMIF